MFDSSCEDEPGSPVISDQTPSSRICREPRQLFGKASSSALGDTLNSEDDADNTGSGFQKQILKELKSMNERLRKVEDNQVSSPSSSSGTPPSSVERRAKIPHRIRVRSYSVATTVIQAPP